MRLKINTPENFLFETKIPVRITDINYGGHLGNDVFLTLIHEARVQFLNHNGFSETDIEGVGIIMNEAELSFRKEVFYGDTLIARVTVDNIGRTSCDFYYSLIDSKSGEEVCRARTGAVFFDYSKRKISRIPQKFLVKFKRS